MRKPGTVESVNPSYLSTTESVGLIDPLGDSDSPGESEPSAVEVPSAAYHVPPALPSGSSPHQVEEAVQRRLLSQPELRFSSLVIRRIRDGVCLEGVLDATDDSPDVCSLARSVAGVEQVLNHLVVQHRPSIGR